MFLRRETSTFRPTEISVLKLPITVRQAQKIVSKFVRDSERASFLGWSGANAIEVIAQVSDYGNLAFFQMFCMYPNPQKLRDGLSEAKKLKVHLDRLAAIDPTTLLEEKKKAGADSPSPEPQSDAIEDREAGESRPKDTMEVAPPSSDPEDGDLHGGDGNSGEVESCAETSPSANQKSQSQSQDSPEFLGQSKGEGDPQDGENRSACDAPQSTDSETGNATSEQAEQGGSAQNSIIGTGSSSSTALEDDRLPQKGSEKAELRAAPDETCDASEGAQPRDAAPKESGDFQAIEDSEQSEKIEAESLDPAQDHKQPGDAPQHQTKWGKKIKQTARLSASADKTFGGVTADLKGIGVDAKLLKLCRQRLAALVGDSSHDQSPRRDYQEFCVRLQSFRNPSPARKEEQGRPVILIMADVSGSCASFSDQSVKVAIAASSLGVPGADILVLSHSNGYPIELQHNGKDVEVSSIGATKYEHAHDNKEWYGQLLRRYPIQVVVALGDWDAVNDYVFLAFQRSIDRLIWLNNAYCSSRGTVEDGTKETLEKLQSKGLKVSQIRHKLTYKDGCKNAIAFIENIR